MVLFVSWDLHVGKTVIFLTFAMLFHFLCLLWTLGCKEFVLHQEAGQTDHVFTASSQREIFIIDMTCGVNLLIVCGAAPSECELQATLVNET